LLIKTPIIKWPENNRHSKNIVNQLDSYLERQLQMDPKNNSHSKNIINQLDRYLERQL